LRRSRFETLGNLFPVRDGYFPDPVIFLARFGIFLTGFLGRSNPTDYGILLGDYPQNTRQIIDEEQNTRYEEQEHHDRTNSHQNSKGIGTPRKKSECRKIVIARKNWKSAFTFAYYITILPMLNPHLLSTYGIKIYLVTGKEGRGSKEGNNRTSVEGK